MMRPADFEAGKRYPAMLNIHGGPFGQYGNHLFDEFQIAVAETLDVVVRQGIPPGPRRSP